ncbi:SipW-dependent-type signal peptide-containing protein [Dietzia maris]
MDATTPLTPEAQRKLDRARKRKAILAGGVVLGLGAAVTLAAWSDDVFANGVFSTGGNFALQGAVDPLNTEMTSKDWRPYGTAAGAAVLTFAASMAPGETVYAPFSIQSTEETDLPGTLTQLSAYTDGGVLSPFLSYSIGQDATTCVAGGTGNGIAWASQSGLTTVKAPGTLTGTAPAVAPASADEVPLCIAVTLADTQDSRNAINAASGDVATTITWDFLGTQTTTP